jgi:hypothetical protein
MYLHCIHCNDLLNLCTLFQFVTCMFSIFAAHFLRAVKQYNGCPQKIRAECGTENFNVEQLQMFLRHKNYSTQSDCFLYGKSTANQ